MNAMLKPAQDDDFVPAAPGALTERQRLFVRALVENGGVAVRAAETAGYAEPKSSAWNVMQLPHVQAAIRAETERMVASAGPKAIGWMMTALDDQKMAGAVRFQCAKWLAEAAGHGLAAQRAALGLPEQDKPLSEMTLEELDAFISAGKAATDRLKQDRARTIEGEVRSDARNSDAQDA